MEAHEYEAELAAMDAEIEQLLVDNIKLAGRIPDELVDDLYKAMARRIEKRKKTTSKQWKIRTRMTA